MSAEPSGEALRQAAEWFARLQDERAAESEQSSWRQWLAADEAHAHAWRRVEQMSGQFAALPAGLDRQAAREALERARGPSRRQVLKGLGGIATGSLAAWAAHESGAWQRWTADVATGIGEQRELALPDGSRLWLNTDSAVNLAFGETARELDLLRGEVLIETARDTRQRPMRVRTPEGVVVPHGTKFSVYRSAQACQVDVFAGEVAIQCREGPSARVPAGRRLSFDASRIGAATEASQAQREAWTRGLLLADEQRLDEFLAELGRYRAGHIGCAPEVAGLRLVGAFPLAQPERIFEALEHSLPVKVRRVLPGWTRVEAA